MPHDPPDGLGMDGDVGIEEEHDRRDGDQRPGVPGGGGTERRLVPGDRRTELLGERGRSVGRAVVHDDKLIVGPERISESSKAALEVPAPVVNGDHHGERRPSRPPARRTGGEIIHDPPSPVCRGRAGMRPVPGIARTRAGADDRTDGAGGWFGMRLRIRVADDRRLRRARGTLAASASAVNAAARLNPLPVGEGGGAAAG